MYLRPVLLPVSLPNNRRAMIGPSPRGVASSDRRVSPYFCTFAVREPVGGYLRSYPSPLHPGIGFIPCGLSAADKTELGQLGELCFGGRGTIPGTYDPRCALGGCTTRTRHGGELQTESFIVKRRFEIYGRFVAVGLEVCWLGTVLASRVVWQALSVAAITRALLTREIQPLTTASY